MKEMTITELFTELKKTNYPVEYSHFKSAQEPPFITYLRTSDENISSDFSIHGKIKSYDIELYTDKKDLTAEQNLEKIIDVIDTEYTTDETFIEEEKLYQVVYHINLKEKR